MSAQKLISDITGMAAPKKVHHSGGIALSDLDELDDAQNANEPEDDPEDEGEVEEEPED